MRCCASNIISLKSLRSRYSVDLMKFLITKSTENGVRFTSRILADAYYVRESSLPIKEIPVINLKFKLLELKSDPRDLFSFLQECLFTIRWAVIKKKEFPSVAFIESYAFPKFKNLSGTTKHSKIYARAFSPRFISSFRLNSFEDPKVMWDTRAREGRSTGNLALK